MFKYEISVAQWLDLLLKWINVIVNSLPHKDNFWHTAGNSVLKTLRWEKKKMLVTSIFFFSHIVFYPMEDNFNILSNI